MEKIQESSENGYAVAYRINDNSVLVVRVSSKGVGVLEAQRVGLESKLERLTLHDGIAQTHDQIHFDGTSHAYFLDEPKNEDERISQERRFGEEFRAVFQANATLQAYVTSHFKNLEAYL